MLSSSVVVLWTLGRLKRTRGLSAESGHKHERKGDFEKVPGLESRPPGFHVLGVVCIVDVIVL